MILDTFERRFSCPFCGKRETAEMRATDIKTDPDAYVFATAIRVKCEKCRKAGRWGMYDVYLGKAYFENEEKAALFALSYLWGKVKVEKDGQTGPPAL